MLGDPDSGASGDESCCSGDIERAARIAAGATGVNERVKNWLFKQGVASCAANGDGFESTAFDRQWLCGSADGFREADDLFDCLSFHPERDEQRRDLSVRAFRAEYVGHDCAGFLTAERLGRLGGGGIGK